MPILVPGFWALDKYTPGAISRNFTVVLPARKCIYACSRESFWKAVKYMSICYVNYGWTASETGISDFDLQWTAQKYYSCLAAELTVVVWQSFWTPGVLGIIIAISTSWMENLTHPDCHILQTTIHIPVSNCSNMKIERSNFRYSTGVTGASISRWVYVCTFERFNQ